jgi:hypothetical protein
MIHSNGECCKENRKARAFKIILEKKNHVFFSFCNLPNYRQVKNYFTLFLYTRQYSKENLWGGKKRKLYFFK